MKQKKAFYIAYIALIGAFAVALLGFAFLGTGALNESHAETPRIWQDGTVNQSIAADLEAWAVQKVGLRTELLEAEARLQAACFHTSSVENVIVGEDGWLYFRDTTNDYLGVRKLSDRQIFNLVHTMELANEAMQKEGRNFRLAVAPNKNSLYDHMPYQYRKISAEGDADALLQAAGEAPWLVDLFTVFQSRPEELYYKTDTHWNSEGAELVAGEILAALGRPGEPLSAAGYTVRENAMTGDLEKMLYPLAGKNEAVWEFTKEPLWHYTTRTRNTEQPHIETENPSGSGRLLMFRDSFANNLIEHFSDAYAYAVYEKTLPFDLGMAAETEADDVVIEIAERNIYLLQEEGLQFTAPLRTEPELLEAAAAAAAAPSAGQAAIGSYTVEEHDGRAWLRGTLFSGDAPQNIADEEAGVAPAAETGRIYYAIAGEVYELTPQTVDGNALGFTGLLPVDPAAAAAGHLIVETTQGFRY
ncbi:MAG: hypothetical protein IJM69_02170 [Firmicutes bacterium]|nr:hypothetical protein [Bacillota bacterium]